MRTRTAAPWKMLLGVGVLVAPVLAGLALPAGASTPAADKRLTNDQPGTGGYVSNYTAVTGKAYTDPTLTECTRSRGRQNEPSTAVDPRNPKVIIGSSNDYCGVYNDGVDADGAPKPVGPIWLGYYRSQDGGRTFQSSLLPGYPGDTSPYAARSQIRTASAGDAVLAWDGDGRLFAGSESSDGPAGSKKTFGDVFVATYENAGGSQAQTADDGKEYKRSVIVDRGSSGPGKFNDKTAIAADRSSNPRTRGNVYFAYSRFVGSGGSNIYFSRSTDHGVSYSHPALLTTRDNDVQFPDIAVNGDGTVTVTWIASVNVGGKAVDAVRYAVSRNGGATFGPARTLTTFKGYSAQDVPSPASSSAVREPDVATPDSSEAATGSARDCGVLRAACASRYMFFRHDTQARSAADQTASSDPNVYVVLDPSVPRTETPTGTTYGSIDSGTGSQEAVYALRFNPRSGAKTGPVRISHETTGHQLFPDVAVDGGMVHVLWYDSRHDTCYSPARPIGNCANLSLVPSLDVYGATLDSNLTATGEKRLTDVTSQPNVDQFGGRTVPFAGDYLWLDSAAGTTYAVWTDYRDTVLGDDPRTTGTRGDVRQCRAKRSDGSYTGDMCPRLGGLDQNVYGDLSP